jgi:hypothetical protein
MGPGNDRWAAAMNDRLRGSFGDLVNELPAKPATDEERRSIAAEPYRRREVGRLPSSGLPMSDVRAERNRDHPADTDLCFERGQYTDRVRLTPADRFAVIAALAGTSPGSLLDLREQAGELARQGVPEEHGHGNVNLAAAFTRLVDYAYIAGQADFSAGNGRGAARDYLLGLAEDRDGKSGDMAHLDVEALERVIAMLEEK